MAKRRSGPPVVTRRALGVAAWASADWMIWVAAYFVANFLRYDLQLAPLLNDVTLGVAVIAATAHSGAALITGAYSRVSLRGTFDEVRALATSTAVITLGLFLVLQFTPSSGVPRSVPLLAGLSAYSLMLALRFVARSTRELRALNHKGKTPIIIFGAGAAGRLLVHNLLNDTDSEYRPVCFLDDDRALHRRRVGGVPVKGGRDKLELLATRKGVKHMVIAIPSASGEVIAELRHLADEADLEALVLPPLSQLVGGQKVTGRDIREIHLEDLLGRRPITLDAAAISEAIAHKVVLVTGAGGSIGSELCRQLAKFHPRTLVLLDRDETALQSVTLDLYGDGLLESRTVVLADIRDPRALADAFREHRPDIVFHAAALKHLPMLEAYPVEAWKTNVLGTLNVLEAAAAFNVETFVNISTDKAADPTSVLGYSKRMAERLTAAFAARGHDRYFSVRFGNVLGSRGSVIPAFQAQISRGGPVTVTHPEVRRYFMLIPEACQLVMQAASMGRRGEAMVLEMGEPVKILDVAETLISLSGNPNIEIQFTGLRPGEKMSEDLFHSIDDERPTAHPLVTAVTVPPLADAVREVELTVTTVHEMLHRYGRHDRHAVQSEVEQSARPAG